MLVKTTLFSALAATAAAEMAAYPAHLVGKRSLEARQTVDLDKVPGLSEATACVSAFLELYTTLPTPPPQLVEELVKQTAVPDICSYTPPASIAAAYSSYESVFQSWYTANQSKLSSALSKCPDYATSVDKLSLCTKGANGGSGGKTEATPTAGASGAGATGGAKGGSSGGSGPAVTGAAARPAGVVGGLVGLVAFLGVVVAL